MVEQWFTDWKPDWRLVLACQLHDEHAEPTFSEAAVALLLATPAWAERARIKPQALLFRPITAESDTADRALATLLRAEPAPVGKIKHIWFGQRDKIWRHAAGTAVRDAGLNAATHDVDRAIGQPGPVNGWLLQALAAQMVQHGQGPRLVATAHATGAAWNIVASHSAQVAEVPYPPMRYFSAPCFAAALATVLLTFCMALPKLPGTNFMLMMLALIPVSVVLQVGIEILNRKSTTRYFSEEFFLTARYRRTVLAPGPFYRGSE
jgi:hypothetical protein